MKSIPLNKFNFRIIFPVLLTLFIISCAQDKIIYPEPAENPVNLTAEAQSKKVFIKHMMTIGENKPNYENPEWSDDGVVIRDDWIVITFGYGLPHEVIEITVTENNTNLPRTYEIITFHKWLKTPLIIIQSGKNSE